MGIIIFDLEGVLIDNKKRYYSALRKADPTAKSDKQLDRNKKKIFWDAFFDPALSDKLDEVNPKALKILDKYARQGKKIVILSGSKKEVVKKMIAKIKKYAEKHGYLFQPAMIIWRRDRDYRKSGEFKADKAKIIEKMLNDEIEEVHDDDENVIKKFEEMGIKTVHWVDLEPKNI